MASLGPNATLPPVILEVLKSLSALSSENGLLRHDNLVLSGLAEKDFAALFGFPSLDKVKLFAVDVENLVKWKSFPITNGAAREASLKALDEKVREYNAKSAVPPNTDDTAAPLAAPPPKTGRKKKHHTRLKNRILTQIDTILLGLFVLRTGAHQAIASLLFSISQMTTSVYFQASLELIVLHSERQAQVFKLIAKLPKSQRKHFRSNTPDTPSPDPSDLPDYVFIIDGTELKTQIASDRPLRRAMWSEYKHSQT